MVLNIDYIIKPDFTSRVENHTGFLFGLKKAEAGGRYF